MLILREIDLVNDCVAGFTKVFISTPQTISYLENLRLEKLKFIVVFLQKVGWLLFSTTNIDFLL